MVNTIDNNRTKKTLDVGLNTVKVAANRTWSSGDENTQFITPSVQLSTHSITNPSNKLHVEAFTSRTSVNTSRSQLLPPQSVSQQTEQALPYSNPSTAAGSIHKNTNIANTDPKHKHSDKQEAERERDTQKKKNFNYMSPLTPFQDIPLAAEILEQEERLKRLSKPIGVVNKSTPYLHRSPAVASSAYQSIARGMRSTANVSGGVGHERNGGVYNGLASAKVNSSRYPYNSGSANGNSGYTTRAQPLLAASSSPSSYGNTHTAPAWAQYQYN